MFTQCSKCETVFKLSAEVLRAAGGQVRCGKCGEVFNALAHLAEDASAFAVGESSFDLETRADRILQSPAPQTPRPAPEASEDPAPSGIEIARLQILDWNESDSPNAPAEPVEDPAAEAMGETSLEFTLPPGELDRIFVETKKGVRPRMPPGPAQEPRGPAPEPRVPVPEPRVPVPEPAEHMEAEEIEVFNAANPIVGIPAPATVTAATEATAAGSSGGTPSGFEVSEEVRREMLSGIELSAHPESLALERADPPLRRSTSPFDLAPQKSDRAFIPWLAAAIIAGALLLVQVVHQNREWLATHAPLGGSLRSLYGAMGAPVAPPANLSAYQLRQWGVTGDPAGEGTLRVRASILNTAAQLEPYPLLRVTLANRFGGSIGTRDFEPSEYLGKPTAKLLAPGERADATLDILDPGKSAEGFEIDVCLRGADRRVSCANDKAPAQAKR
ncbi:MAG TPA: DUF3426 domain-containing protein [Steroidobacteraceae bacterium]|nr:DUF3426 domain-containing protein [Steroidobacteraceae bacterium]